MPLDINPDIAASFEQSKDSDSALKQLGQAFLYETQQQLTGLAQIANSDANLNSSQSPAEADSLIGKNAQLFGRAAADAIPIIVTGLAMRAGFGKLMPNSVETAESLMLRRPPIGLSVAESAATGFVTGSLLKPSDENARQSTATMLSDRLKSGAVSAMSFGFLSGVNSGAAVLGERFGSPLVKAALANPISAGVLSGIPGGVFNAELESVSKDSRGTLDPSKIGQSIYQMSIVGGVFGGANLVAGRVSEGIASSTTIGAVKGDAEFNIFTAPRPKPGTLTKLLSNLPKPEDWLRLDFGQQPAFAGMGSLGANLFENVPVSEPSAYNAALKVEYKNPNLKTGGAGGVTGTAEKQATTGKTLNAVTAADATPTKNAAPIMGAAPVADASPLSGAIPVADATPVTDAVPAISTTPKSETPSLVDGSKPFKGMTAEYEILFLGNGPGKELTYEHKLLSVEEADLGSLKSFISSHGESGKNAVSKLIDAGAHSRHLTQPGLDIFLTLDSLWNPSVETTRNLLSRGPRALEVVSELEQYIRQDPEPRIAEVEKLVNGNASIRDLDPDRIEALNALSKIFVHSPEIVPKLVQSEKQFNLIWLASRLKHAEPAALEQLVRLANKSPQSELLNTSSIGVLGSLSKAFGFDPVVTTRLESMSPISLTNLNNYLAGDIDGQRASQVRQLISEGAPDALLDSGRLKGIADIEKATADSQALKTRIFAAESQGLSLREVGSFLSKVSPEDMAKAFSVTEQAIDKTPLAKIDKNYLAAKLDFSDDGRLPQGLAKRLLDLSDAQGLDLRQVHKFLYGTADTVARARIVADQLKRKVDPQELTYNRLTAIYKLYDNFDKSSVAQLLDLETPRVPITQIDQFASSSMANTDKLDDFLNESNPKHTLDLQQLTDSSNLSKIEKYFPKTSETFAHISELQKESLSTFRLANFIAEDPASRMSLVDMLAEDKADTKTFNTHMKLSVLPDSIAYDVVEAIDSGDIQLPRLFANMRSFDHGRAFTDLLTNHVRSGGALTQKALDELFDRAKQPADGEPANGVKTDGTKSGGTKSRESKTLNATSNTLSKKQRRTPLAFDEDGLRESHLTPEIGHLSSTLETASEALTEGAQRIDKIIPTDKTIVLLGRDTWPLVPLLKARGRDVQYFMWTRLQNEDQATMNQWLKEVPPNSAVLDTGFMGTIFDAIRKIDPSATGYLLNSDSHYKQLLPYSIAEKVAAIEGIPKMIGRSSSHTKNGNAISKQSYRDDGDRESSFASRNEARWQVEQETEKLLRKLGLSEWDVWRYRDYVGLTPSERLGYDNKPDVLTHYDRVAKEREQQDAQTHSSSLRATVNQLAK